MTLEERLAALSTQIGGDVKTLITSQGVLTTLSTTTKTSLVAAINELFGLIGTGGGSSVIDDAETSATDKTWSIDKIVASLEEFRDDLLGGVPATTFDTLKEIADYLVADETATSGLVTAMANRVRFDAVQTLDSGQKAQARANIGALSTVEIGDPDTDFVTIYNTAKA